MTKISKYNTSFCSRSRKLEQIYYINNKISQTPELFYKDTVLDIPDSQAFYITDKGIVLYFEVDEIAKESAGVPKFLVPFEQFSDYINPRFYCNPENVLRRKRRR